MVGKHTLLRFWFFEMHLLVLWPSIWHILVNVLHSVKRVCILPLMGFFLHKSIDCWQICSDLLFCDFYIYLFYQLLGGGVLKSLVMTVDLSISPSVFALCVWRLIMQIHSYIYDIFLMNFSYHYKMFLLISSSNPHLDVYFVCY